MCNNIGPFVIILKRSCNCEFLLRLLNCSWWGCQKESFQRFPCNEVESGAQRNGFVYVTVLVGKRQPVSAPLSDTLQMALSRMVFDS